MFERQQTGSVVCPGCGRLVGVQDERCWNCGRARPSLFGFSRVLQRIGNEAAFSTVVIGICVVIFVLSLAMAPGRVNTGLGSAFSPPTSRSLSGSGRAARPSSSSSAAGGRS